jgi:hypothetical protein
MVERAVLGLRRFILSIWSFRLRKTRSNLVGSQERAAYLIIAYLVIRMFRKLFLLLALLAPTAAAAQSLQGFYIGAAGGPNFAGSPESSDGHVQFNTDVGGLGLASLGWAFGNGFRVELEGSYRSNGISSIDTLRQFWPCMAVPTLYRRRRRLCVARSCERRWRRTGHNPPPGKQHVYRPGGYQLWIRECICLSGDCGRIYADNVGARARSDARISLFRNLPRQQFRNRDGSNHGLDQRRHTIYSNHPRLCAQPQFTAARSSLSFLTQQRQPGRAGCSTTRWRSMSATRHAPQPSSRGGASLAIRRASTNYARMSRRGGCRCRADSRSSR